VWLLIVSADPVVLGYHLRGLWRIYFCTRDVLLVDRSGVFFVMMVWAQDVRCGWRFWMSRLVGMDDME